MLDSLCALCASVVNQQTRDHPVATPQPTHATLIPSPRLTNRIHHRPHGQSYVRKNFTVGHKTVTKPNQPLCALCGETKNREHPLTTPQPSHATLNPCQHRTNRSAEHHGTEKHPPAPTPNTALSYPQSQRRQDIRPWHNSETHWRTARQSVSILSQPSPTIHIVESHVPSVSLCLCGEKTCGKLAQNPRTRGIP